MSTSEHALLFFLPVNGAPSSTHGMKMTMIANLSYSLRLSSLHVLGRHWLCCWFSLIAPSTQNLYYLLLPRTTMTMLWRLYRELLLGSTLRELKPCPLSTIITSDCRTTFLAALRFVAGILPILRSSPCYNFLKHAFLDLVLLS
ncbi:hypothetical protein CPC08DRAFT_35923 [Agrocybe pediades]|nr:hypothetical protein CPC08DRAFT_35923 [Agrocybe pediades]